jgi:hypothetical protein
MQKCVVMSEKFNICRIFLMMLSVLGLYSIDDGMINEYGAVGGMSIDSGNRNTRRKSAPVSLYSPQNPHDLTWCRTWVASVRNRHLTD